MFIPITYQALETSGPALVSDPEALLEDTPGRRRAIRSPTSAHDVTEEVLDELGKALARRLNALVDALDLQERTR